MDVFDLFARLSLDSSQFDSGLAKSEGSAKSFGSSIKSGLSVVGAGVAATTAAIGQMSSSFVSAAGSAAAYGDSIDKASQKMGVSASFYQEWDAVLQHSGTSMSSMTTTFKTLAKASQDATDDQAAAFAALGMSTDEIKNLNSEELFTRVITGLQGMEESTERTVIATQLLGKGAMEMGALLNTSAEDTQAMIDNVNRLGGVMSDEAVKSAAAYQDSLQDLTTSIDSVKRGVVADFLPSMVEVMNGLTAVFSGDMTGMDGISNGIDTVIQKITDSVPVMLDSGAEIILTLADAIIGNIPKLAEPVVQIVGKIGDFIVDALPQLVSAAMQIVLTLAGGISGTLPTLIPAVVDAVITIAETLIDNVDLIIDAGLQIVLGLVEGVVTAIPRLVNAVPQIITAVLNALSRSYSLVFDAGIQLLMAVVNAIPQIITALADALPMIITSVITFLADNTGVILEGAINLFGALIAAIPDVVISLQNAVPQIIDAIVDTLMNFDWLGVGRNLLAGIVDGFKNSVPNLIGGIKDAGSDMLSGIQDFFGIHSPSTVFRDKVGKFLAEGVGEGFTDEMDSVKNAMADSIPTDINTDINVKGSVMRSTGVNGTEGYNNITVNINGVQYQNFNDLAAAIGEQLNFLTERRTASYA